MAWVGAAEMAQWGQEEMLPLPVSAPCQGAGCWMNMSSWHLSCISLCPLGHTQSVPSCGTALGKVPPPSSWESPPDPLRAGTGGWAGRDPLVPVLMLVQDELACQERHSPHSPGSRQAQGSCIPLSQCSISFSMALGFGSAGVFPFLLRQSSRHQHASSPVPYRLALFCSPVSHHPHGSQLWQ